MIHFESLVRNPVNFQIFACFYESNESLRILSTIAQNESLKIEILESKSLSFGFANPNLKDLYCGFVSSRGLVVRQKTHDQEVLGSNPRWGDHFSCTIHLDQIMETNLITWHCCMCCNPANGRVDFVDGWHIYLHHGYKLSLGVSIGLDVISIEISISTPKKC